MKITDIKGMNNAFWMNAGNQTATGGKFEIERLRNLISRL